MPAPRRTTRTRTTITVEHDRGVFMISVAAELVSAPPTPRPLRRSIRVDRG